MSLNEFEQLLKRYNEGTCTEEERKWVEKWMQETHLPSENRWDHLSPEDKQHYIDNLFGDIRRSVNQRENVIEMPTRGNKKWKLWISSVAAAVVLLIVGYLVLQRSGTEGNSSTETVEWITLNIEAGKRKKITLQDGTMIWLQGGSSLTYPAVFQPDVRLVKLDGEGFFEVMPNKEKPFIVQSGNLKAQVLGTSFNVKAFSQLPSKVISLVEGRLAVRKTDGNDSITSEVLLSPGEAAVFSSDKNILAKSDLPVFGTADEFKAGNLQFEDTPLDEVLYRLGQAYGINIQYDSKKAKELKITGAFLISDPVKEVLKSVARSTRTRFIWQSKDTVEFKL